jgi:L-fucose isomerase-like protein
MQQADTDQRGGLVPLVGVAALSSPLEVGAARAAEVGLALALRLTNAGCRAIELGVVDDPEAAVRVGRQIAAEGVDALVLAPVTWCEDYLVLDLLEECAPPVLFWPLPGMETGALCGAQQTSWYLKQLGQPFEAVFGPTDDSICLKRAMVFLRAAALHRRLRRARIGLAGHHVNGMTHTAPNELMLKKAIGPRVVHMDLPSILSTATASPTVSTSPTASVPATTDAADRARDEEVERVWRNMVGRAGSSNVSDEDGTDSIRVYIALRDAIRTDGLHALGVGCYPHLMGRVCLPASLLADEGVPLACEGDVHGAVGMLMLWLLTGRPTHCTDWLDPLDDSTVIFTHCGSGSFDLAQDRKRIVLDSVRLMGNGVCALFPAMAGPVTLVGLVPTTTGYLCALLTGEAIPTEMVFPGNPVRVRFDQSAEELIRWIGDCGIGHHWMIGYGDVSAEIAAWAGIAGADVDLVSP